MELHQVNKRFGEAIMVDNFSYIFKKKDRIGIVGKNGVGKSTFLDLLTGKTQPDSGEIIPGVTTRIGYFTQEVEDLNPAHRVIEEVKEIAEFITLADGSQVSASKFLDTFLFPPEKQYNFIEKLSGGEKKRLQLLKVLVRNPNFLVLDDPTNDFDIDTLNVLEEFLEKFNGCLVLVSHDRYFMDHLVEQLFVFEGEGKIRLFNGNYSDYRLWADGQTDDAEEQVLTVSEQKPETPKKRLNFKEKQEFERLPSEIQALENQKAELTNQMNSGLSDHLKLQELATQIKQVGDELDNKTMRWLELSELEKS